MGINQVVNIDLEDPEPETKGRGSFGRRERPGNRIVSKTNEFSHIFEKFRAARSTRAQIGLQLPSQTPSNRDFTHFRLTITSKCLIRHKLTAWLASLASSSSIPPDSGHFCPKKGSRSRSGNKLHQNPPIQGVTTDKIADI